MKVDHELEKLIVMLEKICPEGVIDGFARHRLTAAKQGLFSAMARAIEKNPRAEMEYLLISMPVPAGTKELLDDLDESCKSCPNSVRCLRAAAARGLPDTISAGMGHMLFTELLKRENDVHKGN